MPITNHVTSLELSRRLKELGVPQNSHFVWFNNSGITGDAFWTLGYKEEIIDNGVTLYPEKTISAYLASELGELLPVRVNSGRRKYKVGGKPVWFCNYSNKGNKIHHNESSDTLADAMAQLLIWLLENHLISIEELGK